MREGDHIWLVGQLFGELTVRAEFDHKGDQVDDEPVPLLVKQFNLTIRRVVVVREDGAESATVELLSKGQLVQVFDYQLIARLIAQRLARA